MAAGIHARFINKFIQRDPKTYGGDGAQQCGKLREASHGIDSLLCVLDIRL
jgi:hypothetical protein